MINSKKVSFRKYASAAGLVLMAAAAVIIVILFYLRKAGSVYITGLQTYHLTNPIGLDEENPVFGWRMEGDREGLAQSAYRITAAASLDDLNNKEYIWDSGKVTDSVSAAIPYEGEPLQEKTRYFWKVTVWDEQNRPFTSEEAFFETGLMGTGMGEAKWICAPEITEEHNASDSDYVYSIHYDMEVENSAAGFVFGAEEGRYGDMYICRISNGEEAVFSLLKMSGGKIQPVLCEFSVSDLRSENAAFFSVDLQIDHENMDVIINNQPAGSCLIESTPAASVGYYKSRGTSCAYLDNLTVADGDGNAVYEENFEGVENIFSPYYVAVEDGRLKIGSGLMLTKGYEQPAPLFYRQFSAQDKKIESASIYMTALGSFALVCNGEKVSEDYFAPGKMVFNQELSYVTYDITKMLRQGEPNALGITLLHGWYDRGVGYPEIFNAWGNKNALLGMLEIRYEDGTTETIGTDSSFLCSTDGPVRMDDMYQGEYYDATFEKEGWGSPGFSCEGFLPAKENEVEEAYLSLPLKAKSNEPIRCVQELSPVTVTEPEEGVFVYDFGQNFAGTCSITVKGEAGQIITMRYAEALNGENQSNRDDAPGTVFTENLLTAEATDYYVLKGATEGETFTPEYTYHGFRYLQVTGLSEPVPTENVRGLVLSSDLEQTGSFECSNELLNRFYENARWSQKSNFMDNPTDCAQRDERHGWAGDAQIYSDTASCFMDTYSFYRKYLRELSLLQSEGGSFPDMAPRNFGTQWDGTGGAASTNCWGDAAMVITWNLYTQYGDRTIIEENYDALCKWVEALVITSDNYIRDFGGYGDHLSLEETPGALSDTAWCANSAALLAKMADVLGKTEEAAAYREIYRNYKTAWQTAFVQADGTTICDTQTSYVLGLAFDLFPEELKKAAAERLDMLMEYNGFHLYTGFSGIRFLLPVLEECGMTETAYSILLQEEYPSLLYPVKNGATTTYEKLFGRYENGDGTYVLDGSLNHYAFASPAGWLYRGVLGIKSDETNPGYHHFFIEPAFTEKLSYAEGSYDSSYGTIRVAWERMETGYSLEVTVPPNTTATLLLPDGAGGKMAVELTAGSYSFGNISV